MFHSTRGKKLVSSPQAILNGLADDGGLYVIDKLPKLDYHDLLNDDYQTMAAKILNSFFNEFTFEEIKREIDEAYSCFDIKEVVELKECDNSYFLELFHGPTLAFKDLALVVLPRLMKLSKQKLGYEKNITILTATSGDTGGAALNGFKSIDGVSIVVLYPHGGVSPVQEAQMCSFKGDNAKVLAILGNFDDCQSFVKDFFNEHKDLSLSSANSINIARLAPQVVYYFYSYVNLLKSNKIKDGEKINFDVPTGNFGNIFAGFYAKNMGLPIQNLICASNKNNVLTDFFLNGKYDKKRPFFKTNSPSMDILISSNLERLLYIISGNNETLVSKLMTDLKETGKFTLPKEYHEKLDDFLSYSVTKDETVKAIENCYKKYNYLIDPHTSVGYIVYKKYLENVKNQYKTIVLSTAHPYKFPLAICKALNIECLDEFDGIDKLNKLTNVKIPQPIIDLQNINRKTIWKKEEAYEKLCDLIKELHND